MPEQEQKWVCAHELGHALQHKGLNRIFMDNCTQMVTSRLRKRGRPICIDLLYSDEDLRDLAEYSVATVAQILGVKYELAEYRMNSLAL